MILTYKYRLKDRSARRRLLEHAIACNQVWNYCVATQRECEARYRAGAPKRRWLTTFEFHKLTGGTSRELNTHSGAINEICRTFCESRDRRKRAPKFRASFGAKRALGWVPFKPNSRRIDGNSVWFLDRHYRWFDSRPLPAIVKGGAFVEDAAGKWWVCFQVEVPDDPQCGAGAIGIDLGLKTLAALSDGSQIPNLANYRHWQARLAIAHRAGNKRRARAIHAKITNCRRDQLHKASCRVARENALIAVGNVSSPKLAKTRLAKSVLDAGWSAFRNMLRYKARRRGATYLEVDEKFTTVTCSACAARCGPQGQKGLRIREWVCSDCGARHDRDVNAARNILALGRSAAPPVEGSHDSDKRELSGTLLQKDRAAA